MAEEKKNSKVLPHNVILEGRKTMSISGVADIDRFDEEIVVLYTDLGELTIKGTGLHINRIDVDTGELSLEGEITSLTYDDSLPHKGGLFARLFR